MPRWFSVPNVLTALRLLLTPVVLVAILEGEHRAALAFFAAASATDGLDGYLARTFGWTTPEGAILDPIADKLLLGGVYLAMATAHTIPWWFVGLVLGRDLLILAAAGIAILFTRMRRFPPSVWGKLSTFLQVLTAVVWMARNAAIWAPLSPLAEALLWPAAAATVWSGLHYGWRGIMALRAH